MASDSDANQTKSKSKPAALLGSIAGLVAFGLLIFFFAIWIILDIVLTLVEIVNYCCQSQQADSISHIPIKFSREQYQHF